MSQVRQRSTTSTGDINILLLGQTGVGKTTFINAFANYLVYNSLDEAINGNLQAVIPAWFIFFDKDTFVEKTITIGIPNESEKKGGVGQSCTRECQSFIFRINNRILRLIDAPGIGDTEGILQDEKNFEDILAYISQFDYLNGICILLKPNEERLHILFRFCIKELLRHLHVHAKENIMFIFTNARATSFQPGPSAPLLRELLRSLKDNSNTEVPFSKENSFFFDNEAFRFLALCKNGIEFNPEEKKDYSRSWDHSILEFSRLISRIIKCDKHATRDTLSLNEAQQLIRKLSRPIGEISTLIQENLQLAEQHKNNVISNRAPTPQVLPQEDAEIVPLGYPRTVCTNEKCTKVITIDNIGKVDYTSHCHPHCYLTGVEQETIGHEKLKDCTAMDKSLDICKGCGCIRKEHMHITYEVRKFITNIVMNSKNITQSPIDGIDQRIKNLKEEQEAIIKVCTQLTQFLRVNALNPVNDDILEYIEHFIREEKTKKNAGVQNDDVIAGLEKLLVDYKNEMNILQQAMKITSTTISNNSSNSTDVIKSEQIFLLVGSLYRLPINGAKIREQIEGLKNIQSKFSKNREHVVNLPIEANSSSVMTDLKNIL
ncbi:unnamed protein product [Rotaria sp. Silwood2]|nr:unnamed protein product [Rotaria sp. Silwood2]CAF2849188.1 unnamed protein product [Rotaria sp. Silwood2]CAF4263746.1 unnamed protein product [Rotaria sp. Silwood2]CAF4481215.1 unnamed protein product [Rotaria sp. Silwood2]